MIISLQTSAQRAASCFSGTDNVTKRIVTSNGSRFLLRIRQDARQEAGPRLLKKVHLKENIASCFTPQGCGYGLLAGYFRPTSRVAVYWI